MALSIIGAGLGRTGTSSLKVALQMLGVGQCYHMSELFLHPDHADLWIRAAEGEVVWDRIFAGYGATVDHPGCRFWRELMAYYPAAKVILTVRDPEKWFESTQETILSPQMQGFVLSSPIGPFFQKVVLPQFDGRVNDHDFLIETFKRHNAEVAATVPKDKLLVFEAAQGWEPLCAFLGVPVPSESYPRVNTREEQVGMRNMMQQGGQALDLDAMQDMVRDRFHSE
jgi:Sulfotransferase domain